MLIYIGSHCAPIAIPATTANGVSAQMLEVKLHAQVAPAPKEPMPIRFPVCSLEQCINIFGNGPLLYAYASSPHNYLLAHILAKCAQRKIRCTYVKFHRQMAPSGPGHHNPQPTPPPFSGIRVNQGTTLSLALPT